MGAEYRDRLFEDTRRMKFPKEQYLLTLISAGVGFMHGHALAKGTEIGGLERTCLFTIPPTLEAAAGLWGHGFSGVAAQRAYLFLEREGRIAKGASSRSGCSGFMMGVFTGGIGMGIGMFGGYLYGLMSDS